MKILSTSILIVGLVAPLLRVEATIINVPIANASFEMPDASAPPGYTRNATTPTPGWNWTDGNASGVFDVGGLAPDGVQVGWFFNSTIWQETPAQLTGGDTYQLSLAVARDSAGLVTDTYALYSGTTFAGATLLTSGVVLPPAPSQTFTNVTLTFGPGDPGYAALVAAHAGENLIVAFTASSSAGGAADVDSVQLLEIIPEPSTLLLFGVGGWLLVRRHQQKK